MTLLTVLSSSVYATNAMAAHQKKVYSYSRVCALLTVTSWLYHSTKNKYLCWIDKCAVYSFIGFGLRLVVKKKFWTSENRYIFLVCLISVIMTAYLYVYGCLTGSLCSHPEFGIQYHALMHGFSSLGHHAILLLQ